MLFLLRWRIFDLIARGSLSDHGRLPSVTGKWNCPLETPLSMGGEEQTALQNLPFTTGLVDAREAH